MSSVLVYKTPDSQLGGQGLAGTIDLRTTRPLAYGKRAMAFNLRGETNSNDDLGADSDDKGYRASFSYIDQFLDSTWASPSASRASTRRWRREGAARTNPGIRTGDDGTTAARTVRPAA